MLPPQQDQWIWDGARRMWYMYDQRTDEFVYEDHSRVPRTPYQSASSTAPASAAHHSRQTSGQDSSYRYASSSEALPPQTGPWPTQYAPQVPLTASRPSGASKAPVERATAGLSSLAINTTTTPASAPYPAQASTPQVIKRTDEKNQVQVAIQTGPRDAITDSNLARQGIWAHSLLLETPGEAEKLFDSYRQRSTPRKYFTIGRVFMVLWSEPQGEGSTIGTGIAHGTSLNRYGEPVFSKTRRFVVIRQGDSFSSALPVTTYHGQGVAKRGVKKSEHSIIHTGKTAPPALPRERPQRDEAGMQPDAIRVVVDDPSDKFDVKSRLDYAKVHTVHHNLKVRNIGVVHPNSVEHLHQQFLNVWNHRNTMSPSASALRGNVTPGYTFQQGTNAASQMAGMARPRQESLPSAPWHSQTDSRSLAVADLTRGISAGAGADASSTSDSSHADQLRASAQAAMARMLARGFTRKEALKAIAEAESKARPRHRMGQLQHESIPETRESSSGEDNDEEQEDDGNDDDDDDDDDDDGDDDGRDDATRGASSVNSKRSQPNNDSHRRRRPSLPQYDGKRPVLPGQPPPRQSSLPSHTMRSGITPSNTVRPQQASATIPEARGTSEAQQRPGRVEQSVRGHPPPRQSSQPGRSGGHGMAANQTDQAQSSTSRQHAGERAVAELMRQGYSREEAIAKLRRGMAKRDRD